MKRSNNRALYESIMRKVSRVIKKSLNELLEELDNDDNENNEDEIYYKALKNYQTNFTPELCEYIWNNGTVTPEFLKEDDFAYAFREFYTYKDNFATWKAFDDLCKDVIETVLNNYPGNLIQDVKYAIKQAKLLSNENIDNDYINKYFNKLNNKYAIKLNNKKLKLLFNKLNPEIIPTIINQLLNIPFVQKITNFIAWVSKISLLIGDTRIVEDAMYNINNMISNNIDNHRTSKIIRTLLYAPNMLLKNVCLYSHVYKDYGKW